MNDPNKFSNHLIAFIQAVAERIPSAKAAIQNLIESDEESGMPSLSNLSEIQSTIMRIVKICRFIMCAFGGSCSTAEDFKDISGKDVVWLLSIKGSGNLEMERVMKEIVSSNESWKEICDEIVRTSQSSLTLRPVLERVVDSLRNSPTTASAFRELFKEVRALKAGMRKVDLVELDTLLLEKLRGIGKGVLQSSSEDAMKKGFKTSDMDAIIEGLQLYQSTPGVVDMIQELKDWMTSQVKAMHFSDMMDVAERAQKQQVVTEELWDTLQGLLPKVQGLSFGNSDRVTYFMTSLAVTSLRGLLLQARQCESSLH